MQTGTDKLQQLIEYYQQVYFTHDDPVPFIGKLQIYPVMVTDYYLFYSLIDIFKLDKNADITGVGISMTHLGYFIYHMKQDTEEAQIFTNKAIKLFELIFHIKNGIKCTCDDHNDTFLAYSDLLAELVLEEKKIEDSKEELTDDQLVHILSKIRKCPKCGQQREDIIRFNKIDDRTEDLIIDGVEIKPDNFELLRKIVLYQNIPDYNDEYINPELKAELELAAKLENPNNVTPTLEKQELCLAASTSYTLEEIKKMSIRHMVMLLRTVDAKLHYFTYKQAESSGFVKFSSEIQHWVYSSDKPKSLLDRAMSLSGLKTKMAPVTGGQ